MNMTMKVCIIVVSMLAFSTIDASIVKSNVSG